MTEGRIEWIKEMFPDNITEILVSNEYDEQEINGENCESFEELLIWHDIRIIGFFSVMLCLNSYVKHIWH